MKAVHTIRRLGFRRWYERELLQSHLHLVLLLLSTLALVGAAEALADRGSSTSQLAMVLCAVVSGAVGLWSLRRYLFLLQHAEYVADQAVCGSCRTYARWDITHEVSSGATISVCCRHCGNRWHIGL